MAVHSLLDHSSQCMPWESWHGAGIIEHNLTCLIASYLVDDECCRAAEAMHLLQEQMHPAASCLSQIKLSPNPPNCEDEFKPAPTQPSDGFETAADASRQGATLEHTVDNNARPEQQVSCCNTCLEQSNSMHAQSCQASQSFLPHHAAVDVCSGAVSLSRCCKFLLPWSPCLIMLLLMLSAKAVAQGMAYLKCMLTWYLTF
jgi:hypothetical protein